jgi:amidase
MSLDDLMWLDCVDQASLVRSKDVTPRELVETAIRRIEALDPDLDAIATPLFDSALRDAETVRDGRLAGVPLLVKDLIATVAGARQTEGSMFLRDWIAPSDSEYIVRLRRGGLIPLAKTTTPEFGNASTVESELFGSCRNPWDRTRVAGGSSSGSAAAVAAGLAGAAHGNDGGGSIRIPASCCGLVGLKPSRGRNPLGPEFGDVYSGLVAEHVLTRTVRDSAVFLDITSGPDPGGPYAAPVATRSFEAAVELPPRPLRIGVSTAAPNGCRVERACADAATAIAALSAELGHEVDEAVLEFDAAALDAEWVALWSDGNAWMLELAAVRAGRPPGDGDVEPLTRVLADAGLGRSAADHLRSRQRMQQLSRQIARFFERYDVWLAPTLAEEPVPLGTFAAPPDDPMRSLVRDGEFTPFTPIANMTGQPAISLPLEWSATGLPIGAHLMGRPGEEATLLQLAAQLEQARPWAGRRPPLPSRPGRGPV